MYYFNIFIISINYQMNRNCYFISRIEHFLRKFPQRMYLSDIEYPFLFITAIFYLSYLLLQNLT